MGEQKILFALVLNKPDSTQNPEEPNSQLSLLRAGDPQWPHQTPKHQVPLPMLTAFCPHLKVIQITDYGNSTFLTDAPIQAFHTIGPWMCSYVDAGREVALPILNEETYIRLHSPKKAATSLKFEDLAKAFGRRIRMLEFDQLHINVIKRAYAVSPPDTLVESESLRQAASFSGTNEFVVPLGFVTFAKRFSSSIKISTKLRMVVMRRLLRGRLTERGRGGKVVHQRARGLRLRR